MVLRSLKFPGLTLIVLLLLAPGAVLAQTASGSIDGMVIDKSGSPLPGVTITATNNATGFNRTVVSDSTGNFRFQSLQVGTYSIQAALEGFATVTVNSVAVNVASTRNLEITMGQSSVQESITVTAEAPLVADSAAIGTVVSRKELENLPLNGRQFANLGSLAPGTQLSVNSDPTKPGQLTIALNGGSGRNVNFLVDGGDNTDDTIGGALQNYNLEAVQEFKIMTQQYKAEYGRTTGGVLTVVTKTGTNNFEGSAYGFFRDKSLNEETKSESLAGIGKQPYDRKQYGVSFGGPIVKDRAHFFVTYEKTDRDTEYVIDTDGVFPSEDGRSVSIPFKDELATGKATYNLSAAQYLQVRYGYQKNSDKYGASPLVLPSALGTVTNKYKSLLGGHTIQLGNSRLNEFLYQWTRFENSISADSSEPLLYFPSGVLSGQNPNTPQSTTQEKSQFKDDFSWTSTLWGSHHDFKAGFNYVHEPILGGDFSTGLAGQYQMLQDDPTSPVTQITINGGFFGESTPVDQYSGYIQDDWIVNNRLTVNLGLRYDYWDGFDLDQTSNPIWQTLSTQTTFHEKYLQDFAGGKGGKLSNDDNNWAPRIGFTYDLTGEGRQIVRGGIGIYYDFPYTNATILFPAASVQSNFGTVYSYTDTSGIKNPDGSYFRPGQPLPPNQLTNPDLQPPTEVASPTLATPKSTQASIGYSTELSDWIGLTVDGVYIQYRDIPFRFRANPTLDANGNSQSTRRFPEFGNFRLWYGNGEADYKGVNLGVHARLGQTLQMQGFYTYSKSDGNVLAGADEFRLTASGFQADMHRLGRDASINSLDPLCDACNGPLYTDARHRLTLSAIYDAPFGIKIAGIGRYRSALPYTKVNPAGADLNGDSFRNDLAPGVSSVNSGRGDSFEQVDLRFSKEFLFGGNLGLELIAEVFNIFNADNPAVFDRFGDPSSYAGDPGQGEQRLAQLGARIHF